jgi:hypothetical protein
MELSVIQVDEAVALLVDVVQLSENTFVRLWALAKVIIDD